MADIALKKVIPAMQRGELTEIVAPGFARPGQSDARLTSVKSRLFVVIIYRPRNLSVLEELMNLELFIDVQPDSVTDSELRQGNSDSGHNFFRGPTRGCRSAGPLFD